MRCPECIADGERSRITIHGGTTTALPWSEHYDEDGVRHAHDPNTTATVLICTRGHQWTDEQQPACSVGDYPEKNHA